MSNSYRSLDNILCDIGQLGKYQCFTVILFSIAVIMHSAVHTAFVFTSKDVTYRCLVPDCDTEAITYDPAWLPNAIPFNQGAPDKCERYVYLNSTECNHLDFNSSKERCDQFVYSTSEITILHDFNLQCDENLWKLTLIGTINSVGQFVGLPISGFVSDKYGRLTILIWGMVLSGIAGIMRSFANSYTYFVILEFIDSAFSAGAYTCAYILGGELVGPERRVLVGTLISCAYAVGEVTLGALAWQLQSWRPLLQVLCGSTFLLLSYHWLAPESVRWLLVKNKFNKAKCILRKAAKVNGKIISEEKLTQLCLPGETIKIESYPISDLFKSWTMLLRYINCCFCWITCAFIFYGLTINSVALSSNHYLDFILTSLVEIPGYLAIFALVDRLGRRICGFSSLLLTSASCIGFIFIPEDLHWLKLLLYLIGKFAGTAAFGVCYIITNELFPTPLRHSLMATCSMFGRVGSMIAPQMPLLEQVWKPLPLLLFGVMAAASGLLLLFFPETSNVKLPDTIQEAEAIGKEQPQNKCTFPR